MQIVTLTWQQTIPIRHQVLWPTEAPEYCKVEGDETALHVGVMVEDGLVCVASIYIEVESKTARLRKFATLAAYQGKGIGTHLIHHLIDILTKQGVAYFWFDARASALSFYQRLGFQTSSEVFYKNQVPFYKMHQNLIVKNNLNNPI